MQNPVSENAKAMAWICAANHGIVEHGSLMVSKTPCGLRDRGLNVALHVVSSVRSIICM